jgi:hypothetical protein
MKNICHTIRKILKKQNHLQNAHYEKSLVESIIDPSMRRQWNPCFNNNTVELSENFESGVLIESIGCSPWWMMCVWFNWQALHLIVC